MNRLKDSVTVITGAGKGLGKSIAQLFGSEGAKVIVADINKAAAEKVAESIVSEVYFPARLTYTPAISSL